MIPYAVNEPVRTRVKICGCRSVRDVRSAINAGADAVGVIMAESSPRRVSMEDFRDIARFVPALVSLVAVFVEPPASLVDEALKAGAIPQFHGNEDADWCESFAPGPYLKAYHVRDDDAVAADAFLRFARPFEHATWLFDTARAGGGSGGTGRTFAWEKLTALGAQRAFVVSGGLTPENVGACVQAVRPYAVDVSSGVETNGVKDPRKVRAFIEAVREADGLVAAR
ncbi:MAG: phosphoribosylanthranilate isomerase [Candidatus Eremiobacteraeota bacterium]|nr:phosphoribosylanthranilate isomerase [Candidatus Eremiobacteraeota bacterium]